MRHMIAAVVDIDSRLPVAGLRVYGKNYVSNCFAKKYFWKNTLMRRLLSGLIVLAGIALLLALFSWLKPAEMVVEGGGTAEQSSATHNVKGEPQSPQIVEQLVVTEEPAVAEIEAAIPRVVIEKGHRVSGPEVIRVTQGASVTVEFLSDQAAELHLHGYDRHLHLQAKQVVLLELVAEHSGRFEYELHGKAHGAHHALGVIEVTPQ